MLSLPGARPKAALRPTFEVMNLSTARANLAPALLTVQVYGSAPRSNLDPLATKTKFERKLTCTQVTLQLNLHDLAADKIAKSALFFYETLKESD